MGAQVMMICSAATTAAAIASKAAFEIRRARAEPGFRGPRALRCKATIAAGPAGWLHATFDICGVVGTESGFKASACTAAAGRGDANAGSAVDGARTIDCGEGCAC